MALVIGDAELFLDDLGHTRTGTTGPNLAPEAVGLRPMREKVGDQSPLIRSEFGGAAVGQVRQQCRGAVATCTSDPSTDGALTDTERDGDLPLFQPSCFRCQARIRRHSRKSDGSKCSGSMSYYRAQKLSVVLQRSVCRKSFA